MSLTKETIGATAAQNAGRPNAATGKKTGDAGHPQPVCIEVPVTVQGVRPATDPGKREPFTESTRTIIVFANGAVLRLGTSVNPGQLIFLTNEHTKKEVVSQVVKSKTYSNVPGYVELEFTEPNPGFWGIHFPGEPSEPRGEAQAPGTPQMSPESQPANAASPSLPPAHAEIPRSAPPVRKEPSRTEAQLPASHPSPVYPELIRPPLTGSQRGGEGAGVSEPLVFSKAKRSVAPAASLPQSREHQDERIAPTFNHEPLFEEDTEMEAASAGTHRMPVGSLIAVSLILAAAGGGWYWWHNSGRRSAANLSARHANAAALATPPAVNPQTAPPPSSSFSSTSAPSESETSKSFEGFTHPSAPAPAPQPPLNAALTSHESRQPVEKPAASHESPAKGEKKPAFAGFRLSTPTVARPASRARNLEVVPAVEGAPAIPDAAAPQAMSGLVGSTLQPEAPKPELAPGGELKQARLVSSTPPVYPPLARSQHVEGDVTMDALIDATGRVTTIKIISGPVLLQQAAMAAVRMWKYAPANLDGKPVPVHLAVTVKFRLR